MESRVAIITGGACGIGRGIGRHFARNGIAIVIADTDVERGGSLEAEIRAEKGLALFQKTDVQDEDSVELLISRTLAEWTRVDILCNNAGIERYRIAEEYTTSDWGEIVNTNLRGPFLCSKYAMPSLRHTKGTIVNIASVQAYCCEPKISVYAATKAGLLALTRGMALDYAPVGVRINAICPGAIHTEMLEESLPGGESNSASALATIAQAIPLGRLGAPEDIAAMAYFLASTEASYITGATFVVDGGVLARLAL